MGIMVGLTRTLSVPHEPDEWIEVQLLGWRKLQEARAIATTEALKAARDMGKDLMDLITDGRSLVGGSGAPTPAPANPGAQYDTTALLGMSIVRWSYAFPVDEEHVGALDEVTKDWLKGQIVGLIHPESVAQKNY